MRNATRAIVLFVGCLFLASLSGASAQETEALKSMKSGKVIFDVRSNNLKSVALHMKLIHQTFEDLAAAGKNPEF